MRHFKEIVASAVAAALVAPVAAVILVAPAFMVMLGLGAAHDTWPAVPALGFWSTFLILNGVAIVARAIRGFDTSKEEE